jgi:hypothetical protein
MLASDFAKALGGEVSGHDRVLAPGPGHSPKDRSLSIRLCATAPDGFLVHSHAGDDWKGCRDYVRQRLGLPNWEPGDGREQQRTIHRGFVDKWDFAAVDDEVEIIKPYSDDELRRIENARRLWNECIDPRGTPAEAYLRTRALIIHDDLAGPVLRFHPKMPCRNEDTGRYDYLPCLVACFRSFDTDEVVAIHRTRLHRPDLWPKVPTRLSYGPLYRCAIKLAPARAEHLMAEGLESAMSPREAGLSVSCWAAGSAGMLSKLPVLDGVNKLLLAAEMDKTDLTKFNKASARNIQICRERWHRAGRKTSVLRPTIGDDLNATLMAMKKAEAAGHEIVR